MQDVKLTNIDNAIYIGKKAGRDVIGDDNIAIGRFALHGGSSTVGDNTGTYNITMGYYAGKAITSGTRNIVLGKNAARTCTGTGSDNIIMGSHADCKFKSGGSNIFIGYCCCLQEKAQLDALTLF